MKIISIINISRPGHSPVEGDLIEITYSSGAVLRKIYHELGPSPSVPYFMSPKTFWDRFHADEKDILISHSNQKVKVLLYELRLISRIDIRTAEVISKMNALETAGIIAEGRAAEILAS